MNWLCSIRITCHFFPLSSGSLGKLTARCGIQIVGAPVFALPGSFAWNKKKQPELLLSPYFKCLHLESVAGEEKLDDSLPQSPLLARIGGFLLSCVLSAKLERVEGFVGAACHILLNLPQPDYRLIY